MIDPNVFANEWDLLCRRFRVENDEDVGVGYYQYLTAVMDTEEFLRASRAVFVGRTFFPAPHQFSLVRAGREWVILMDAAADYASRYTKEWKEALGVSQTGWDAWDMIGGFSGLDTTKPKLDVRTKFLEAYVMACMGAALDIAPEVDVARTGYDWLEGGEVEVAQLPGATDP